MQGINEHDGSDQVLLLVKFEDINGRKSHEIIPYEVVKDKAGHLLINYFEDDIRYKRISKELQDKFLQAMFKR